MIEKKFNGKHFALGLALVTFSLSLLFSCATDLRSLPNSAISSDPRKPSSVESWITASQEGEFFSRGYKKDEFPNPPWSKQGDCFVLSSTGFGADLMTRETFESFELEFDWKLAKGGNSGVIFAVQTGDEYSYLSGPEIQLLDDAHHSDGKNSLTSLGALYGLYSPSQEIKKNLVLREYNSSRLIVNGDELKFWVNEQLVSDFSLNQKNIEEKIRDSKFKDFEKFYKVRKGHVLFQDHGGKTEVCRIRIRHL